MLLCHNLSLSIGVTFYELLSGVLPFTQASPNAFIDLVYKHLAVHPRSILEVQPTNNPSRYRSD